MFLHGPLTPVTRDSKRVVKSMSRHFGGIEDVSRDPPYFLSGGDCCAELSFACIMVAIRCCATVLDGSTLQRLQVGPSTPTILWVYRRLLEDLSLRHLLPPENLFL